MAENPSSQCRGHRFQSLVRGLDPTFHNSRVHMLQLKTLRAITKTQHSQIKNLGASQMALVVNVMACAQVGKEFTDIRQDERKTKFIRMGDAVRTAGRLKGQPTLNRGL